MEVNDSSPLKQKLENVIFKEKSYFLNRREINWSAISKCLIASVAIGVVGILLMPAPESTQGLFAERGEIRSRTDRSARNIDDPTQETLDQMNSGGSRRSVPKSLDYLYSSSPQGSSGSSNDDRSGSMILSRGGTDAKTHVPPGSRISVRLFEKAIVANQGMPVIGIVTRDYSHEDSLAIPKGAKLFGEISFDDGGDRAKVDWRTIQFPDGRERQISAIGVGTDGQVGISGLVHSDAVKNTVGQTLTRFIGAYAEGSMQRGALGSNQGGSDNGWKNAIAETAKDRADAMADELKKQRRWIEVPTNSEFFAVITASFPFRDPGAIR